MKTIYEGAVGTSKRVRSILKAKFNSVKFSVRSDCGSCRISWTDGPRTEAVEAEVKHLQSASFDGMIDLESHVQVLGMDENGETVDICGAKYIFCQREMSATLKASLIEKVKARFGAEFFAKIPAYDTYRYVQEAEKGYKD